MLLEIEDRCIQIDRPEKWVWYGDGDSAASLVYFVSLFMVTVHVWQSTTRDPERPDFLLVDLDPAHDCTIGQLARTALRVREFFSELHVDNALVKSSAARITHRGARRAGTRLQDGARVVGSFGTPAGARVSRTVHGRT